MSGVLPVYFLIKEKASQNLCLQPPKRIMPIDYAQQSNKIETFSTFVGHFQPKKSGV